MAISRNKRNYRPTKKGAGMTKAGVRAYRKANPGSKGAPTKANFVRSAKTAKKPTKKA